MDKESSYPFSIQDSLQVREGWKEITNAIHELQQTHPEIVGVTGYGSGTRGEFHTNSDFDTNVFINLDNVDKQKLLGEIDAMLQANFYPANTEGTQLAATVTSRNALMGTVFKDETPEESDAEFSYYHLGIRFFYETLILNKLRDRKILTGPITLEAIPMSHDAVRAVIAEKSKPQPRADRWFVMSGFGNQDSKGRPYRSFTQFAYRLGPLFLLDVSGSHPANGADVASLRHTVIFEMERSSRGEESWSEIADYLDAWLNVGSRPFKAPRTLAAAKRHFLRA